MWILKSLWNYVIIGIKYIADITKTWNGRLYIIAGKKIIDNKYTIQWRNNYE